MGAAVHTDVDRLRLRALALDGRAKLARIAAAIGLSTSAVQARLRGLEETGAIRGYRAEIAPGVFGPTVEALVEVVPAQEHSDEVGRILEDEPGVAACWAVTGEVSHVALARVAGIQELEELLSSLRASLQSHTSSSLVLLTLVDRRTAWPAEPVLEGR